MQKGTVTVCHSRTKNMEDIIRAADIVVAAIGRARYVKGDWIKEGAVVIDVGINQIDDASKKSGKALVGDVEFAVAKERASMITPVPGGVRYQLHFRTIFSPMSCSDTRLVMRPPMLVAIEYGAASPRSRLDQSPMKLANLNRKAPAAMSSGFLGNVSIHRLRVRIGFVTLIFTYSRSGLEKEKVGPMTIAMLLKNTLNLARQSCGLPMIENTKARLAGNGYHA
eukprot:gene334-258_t